ncbi:MAG TPA: transglutaminase-like domain-containing protein [Verrucomicrobiae bacterium]|jgi:regulator of sirC expression with transglutaminase-like and TPR domain|nr:transglutaminase-like domain-containing protein [Verrucomicrobiae bacterium]
MDSSGAIKTPGTLSEGEKAALITLLSDESPGVYHAVRDKIISSGQSAIEWLRPHARSREPALRRRAQEIIQYFSRRNADDRFLAYCLTEGHELNLEQACWLLAQTQYPDISVEAYQAILDSYAGELLERIDLRADAQQILAAFNEYIFDVLGFKGNEQNYYDPENSYLNRVVDRRTGNPINLCLVYLLLARRLRLPISGIGLPGHFICRFQSSTEEYYIDVFNRGKLWTKANCIQYLLSRNYTVQDDYLAPVSARKMLLRICSNLHQIYQHLDLTEDATRLQRYLIALAKS